MKQIIISISIILMSLIVKAQNATTQYDTCQYLQAYQGEWRYINGTDTIRIYLKYNRYYSLQYNNVYDVLWGWHEYKKGSIVVESDYQNRFNSLPYNIDVIASPSWSVWVSFFSRCSNTANILTGTIDDLLQNRQYHNVVINIDPTKTIMTWHQEISEGHLNNPYTGMTLPGDFVLIKQ